jgi:hypothetical protein
MVNYGKNQNLLMFLKIMRAKFYLFSRKSSPDIPDEYWSKYNYYITH